LVEIFYANRNVVFAAGVGDLAKRSAGGVVNSSPTKKPSKIAIKLTLSVPFSIIVFWQSRIALQVGSGGSGFAMAHRAKIKPLRTGRRP
jgi:hypothetical protein